MTSTSVVPDDEPIDAHVMPSGNPTKVADIVDQAFRGEQDLRRDMANMLTPEPTDKVLGVGYDFTTDEMCVKIGEKHLKPVVTKADLLSWISSVFDPLGLVAPYILKGRMFFNV